jgi:putative PIN family toxin of toxin-antitoxin system
VRIVLNTNVLVSAILSPAGAAGAVLSQVRKGLVDAVTSSVLLDEFEEVLERFMSTGAATEIRAAVEELVHVVEPETVPAVARDPDDDQVLAVALEGRAAYVVTRDGDLLSLEAYEGINILEPARFLRVLREEER